MRYAVLIVVLVLLGHPAPLLAQVEDSVLERQAAEILDDNGEISVDIEDALDYLETAPTINAPPIQQLHARPNTSWIDAYDNRLLLAREHADSTVHFRLRSRIGSSLDPHLEQGYISGDYLGSATSYYNRIQLSNDILTFTALEQKRPWELSLTDHVQGFVQLSHPLHLGESFTIRSAIIGDYSLSYGNGLLFGGGFGVSGSRAAAESLEERSFGMRGTLGQSSRALRGLAINVASGPIDIIVFGSQRSLDASVLNDTIQTLYTTNYHRTENELATKDQVRLRTLGTHIEASTSDNSAIYIHGGVTGALIDYDHFYQGTASNPFVGRSMSLIGLDGVAIDDKFSCSAELGLSKTDTSTTLAGIVTALFQATRNFKLGLFYRRVPYAYASPFGSSAGDLIASITNADGYYAGMEFAVVPSLLRLNAYANLGKTLAPITDLFPTQKSDYLISAFIDPTSKLEIGTYFRSVRSTEMAWSDSTHTAISALRSSVLRLRLEAEYQLSNALIVKSRCDYSNYNSFENSWLEWEELRAHFSQALSMQIGMGRFSTDSYNSAIWLYESTVPGSGSIAALYGKGWEINCRIAYNLFGVTLSGDVSGSFFDTSRTIGSGVAARTTSSDLNAVLQLDYRL